MGAYGIARSYEEAREALLLMRRLHLDQKVVLARDLLVYRVLGRDQAALVDLTAGTQLSLSGDSRSILPDPGRYRAPNVSGSAHGGQARLEGRWIANEVGRCGADRQEEASMHQGDMERASVSRLESHLPGLRAE
jgi:hypothetical protein